MTPKNSSKRSTECLGRFQSRTYFVGMQTDVTKALHCKSCFFPSPSSFFTAFVHFLCICIVLCSSVPGFLVLLVFFSERPFFCFA